MTLAEKLLKEFQELPEEKNSKLLISLNSSKVSSKRK